MSFLRSSLCAVAVTAVTITPAFASLENEPRITEGLITVGIAYEISEVCPTLAARRFRGLQYLLALKSAALRLGYSDAEVEAFMDDDAAKDRLEAAARRRLADKGAAGDDAEAYCRVGAAELAADSQIGRLLAQD